MNVHGVCDLLTFVRATLAVSSQWQGTPQGLSSLVCGRIYYMQPVPGWDLRDKIRSATIPHPDVRVVKRIDTSGAFHPRLASESSCCISCTEVARMLAVVCRCGFEAIES
jgi:hypothetical protein